MVEPFFVTVVIPAYNESTRIAGCIAAIRRQTEPPLEIVVVDDGSKDDTAAIAEQLGVHVIVQKNGGIASARNAGIRAATGTWLAFCDADDVWHPEMLALARAAHEAKPSYDFIFADHCTDIDGNVTLASMFAANPDFLAAGGERVRHDVITFERNSLARALARANCVAPSTAIVRRAFVLEHDVFFAPGLPSTLEYHVAEDIEWYLRVLKSSDALAIDRVMLTYHRHAGSVSDNGGRVSYGTVKLGELIAANPEPYVPGIASAFVEFRRAHVRLAGTDYLRSLRFSEARERLSEAQKLRFVPSDELLIVASRIGEIPGMSRVFARLRELWRARAKASASTTPLSAK